MFFISGIIVYNKSLIKNSIILDIENSLFLYSDVRDIRKHKYNN